MRRRRRRAVRPFSGSAAHGTHTVTAAYLGDRDGNGVSRAVSRVVDWVVR